MSANTSCNEAAGQLLAQALAGPAWDRELIPFLAQDRCSDALFRIVAEGLADRFDRRLCDEYARIFSLAIQTVRPQWDAAALLDRYRRVRQARVCHLEPSRVFVLSRVTLGADIAVTSVILDAAKRRFPQARISLAGSSKAAELFARDPRISHFDAPYPRSGSLGERIAFGEQLAQQIPDDERTIVIDPDSRLTQLGLLPLGAESRYFFFESRAYGEDTDTPLSDLARAWSAETFGVTGAAPRIAPPPEPLASPHPVVTVSLGDGGNPAKSLPSALEKHLIRALCSRFRSVIVDRGFGPDESLRTERAVAGTEARLFTGSFAQFASLIAQSSCYVGYDSAGQHAAAACGTPLLTLFKGFVSDRMFARWQPVGPGPKQILKIGDGVALPEIERALDRLLSGV